MEMPSILERTSEQVEYEDMRRVIDIPIKKQGKPPTRRKTSLCRVDDIHSQSSRFRRSGRAMTVYKKSS